MEVAWLRCNIHYYLRNKYFGKAKKICETALTLYADTNEFVFYHGVAYILEGQLQKGINELTALQSDKDLHLGAVLALIYAHKTAHSIDKEALHNLEAKLKEERKQAGAVALYFAGAFLSLAEKYEKASEYINKSLKKDSALDSLILKALNDMYMSNGNLQKSTLDCFELVLSKSEKNIDAVLGLSKFKYLSNEHDDSNLLLDRLIVTSPGQVVPLVEKLNNDFAMQKWEAVFDTMERVFSLEPNNIDALKIRIFIALGVNADYIEAADQLNKFFDVLENEETNNGYLFYVTTQTFSKICGRSSTVLSQVYKFAQYASEMYPHNVEYLSEVGYQCLLQGKTKEALNFFKAASKIDSNSTMTLCGLTLCQMYENGLTDQTSQQVELLFEMQGNQKQAILLLLSAQLNVKNSSKAISFLNTAFETKVSFASRYPFSLSYIRDIDPDFLLEVFKEYKKHLPKKPFIIYGYLLYAQDMNNSAVKKCFLLLETITKYCPGLIAALFELAKLKFLFGFANEAQKLAQKISELENTHAASQVLLAQIYVQQKNFTKAARTLEMCLSYNFKVRDSAMYHLLNGVILKSLNRTEEALASLLSSLQIVTNKNVASHRPGEYDLNIIDKATLYLEIIELQTALGQHGEAGKTLQEAIQELSFTSEESRLQISRAELALHKGDPDTAILLLSEVQPQQPYYFQAHSKMAHVYLVQKQDRVMFTSCFRDIVSNHPAGDAHIMMGDAFISIHEPIQAVESYSAALKGNPGDITLIQKLGSALTKTHEYDRAIQHYENAIKLLSDDELKIEYYELLIKLKQYDKVDAAISTELNQCRNKEKDMNSYKRRVKLLLIQARSRELKNPTTCNTVLILTEAKDIQNAIVKRLEIESRGDIREEKEMLGSILCKLARVKALKEPVVAANLYSEALIYTPRDPDTLLALAQLYANMGDTEKCEQTCAVLLNADPSNEAAAVMMADLAFRKVELESAARHLQQILSVRPCSWEALAHLVEVQWRRGKLAEAVMALDTAKAELSTDIDPGYQYCEGLLFMYEGKVNAALRQLNAARRSPQFIQRAAKKIVLLCLSQYADSDSSGTEDGDTKFLALRTAEKLLAEVAPADRRGLKALLQLATRQKSLADALLQELLPSVGEDSYQDDPYVILAIATAYNIIKQGTRAKNILKRTVASMAWTPEKADGLEKCWLQIAEYQLSAGRADAARDLLNKVLAHNQSCVHAHHYLGLLSEKEQNYVSAADNYDKAWAQSGKADLAVGYKLAHCYLKLKKYPESIVVCRHILKGHPDYPKIKKDIMEKAKANLRT